MLSVPHAISVLYCIVTIHQLLIYRLSNIDHWRYSNRLSVNDWSVYLRNLTAPCFKPSAKLLIIIGIYICKSFYYRYDKAKINKCLLKPSRCWNWALNTVIYIANSLKRSQKDSNSVYQSDSKKNFQNFAFWSIFELSIWYGEIKP